MFSEHFEIISLSRTCLMSNNLALLNFPVNSPSDSVDSSGRTKDVHNFQEHGQRKQFENTYFHIRSDVGGFSLTFKNIKVFRDPRRQGQYGENDRVYIKGKTSA